MDLGDARAMYELQLELRRRARGMTRRISIDDVLEVHRLLAEHRGDLRSLLSRPRR